MTRFAHILAPVALASLLIVGAGYVSATAPDSAIAEDTSTVQAEDNVSDAGGADLLPPHEAEADKPLPVPVAAPEHIAPSTEIDADTHEYVGDGADDESIESDVPATEVDASPAPETEAAPAPVAEDTEEEWVPDADAVSVSITYDANGEAASVVLTDAEGNDVPVGSVSEDFSALYPEGF